MLSLPTGYRRSAGLCFFVAIWLSAGCDHSSAPVSPNSAPTQNIVFDSGKGTEPQDQMTYAKYESQVTFSPSVDITVRSIRPTMWYCNGTSGYIAFIRGEHYEFLASEAGLVDGAGEMNPTFVDRRLDSLVTLRAGSKYLIVMEAWTTKSVGIWTTGARTTGSVGAGSYTVDYAHSDTADHLDRGAIAFQLLSSASSPPLN